MKMLSNARGLYRMNPQSGSANNSTSAAHSGFYTLRAEGNLVTVCAWCNSVRDDNGHWHRAKTNDTYQAGQGLTHTICDSCKTEYIKQLTPALAPVFVTG